jgi:hypothetical protein
MELLQIATHLDMGLDRRTHMAILTAPRAPRRTLPIDALWVLNILSSKERSFHVARSNIIQILYSGVSSCTQSYMKDQERSEFLRAKDTRGLCIR